MNAAEFRRHCASRKADALTKGGAAFLFGFAAAAVAVVNVGDVMHDVSAMRLVLGMTFAAIAFFAIGGALIAAVDMYDIEINRP